MAERMQAGAVRASTWKNRGDARTAGFRDDSYKQPRQLPEPSTCRGCGAFYHNGRWTWTAPGPGEAQPVTCPACQRIQDNFPGGELEIAGDFVGEHREEIDGLIANTAKLENAEHPLHRLMSITDTDGAVVVRTTDTHLARRIGEAMQSAYEGDFEFQYLADEKAIRASWWRGSD
jgi:NMD protein affecting ribosome stability and mRNA decay